jgi:hypothetical protein
MKVAVILTGALRTIKKTIKYFKQNVLLNPNVDVFACIQNDTATSNAEWEAWIRTEMGHHLKHLIWFVPSEHNPWIYFRNKLVSNVNLTDYWKQYLTNSGSMIEHYQMYLSYLEMCRLEETDGYYNYIIRCRTDTIFGKPIDFHWLNWSDCEVEQRMSKVNSELHKLGTGITYINTLTYFMNTILSDSLIANIPNITSEYIPAKHTSIPKTPSDLNEYIKKGEYILTYRANLLYIVSRELFKLVPALPFIYFFVDSPHNSDYWFNSEEQFQSMCYLSNLTIFNYTTDYDGKSLYEYDEKRYFDENYNLINPYLVYCLIRN